MSVIAVVCQILFGSSLKMFEIIKLWEGNFYKLIQAPEFVPISIYLSFVVSVTLSLALVLTSRWHLDLSADGTLGVQKVHVNVTPRVGGLAIFLGVAASYVSASPDISVILGPLWMAGSIAFVIGFLEDLTKNISVAIRLFATLLSGVIGWAITGISLHRLGFSWGDAWLAHLVISVLFTAFAVGGIANAMNIIDGLNGLASGVIVIALTAIAIIAYVENDPHLAFACLSVAVAVLGFFFVNWPMGKLFLGDGGAYFSGFAVAWLAVLLIERNQSVTPIAALLVCIYPFVEVLFSIYRRQLKQIPAGRPDKLHLHCLVYRRYVFKFLPTSKQNSVAGILIAALNVPPALAAYGLRHTNFWAAFACVGFGVGYILIYKRIVRFSWN